ncbi:MAG: phosphate acyltransferase PlsX [Actinomycetales bacterium]|nr:phosphate acyltransferase PlsX [Actinomycetales bacterium]
MTRIAVDLLGGDGAPAVVADAVARLLGDPALGDLDLLLVGPESTARSLLRERDVPLDAVRLVPAGHGIAMGDSPLARLRDHDDVTVTVATSLVARAYADAWVSVGHTGAAVGAAVLGLGRVPGMSRPALAVLVPALAGPVVLLDAGAAPDATPDLLRQFAVAGVAYARTLGMVDPVVGLMSIGSEPGKGDRLRASADELLAETLPARGIRYAGPVEGHDLALGERAQVVVVDGFTGNVLLKGLEGTVRWAAHRMGAAYGDPGPALRVARESAAGDFAGGVLLGVNGVTVVGHGAGTPEQIGACVRLAARVAAMGLVPSVQEALARAGRR